MSNRDSSIYGSKDGMFLAACQGLSPIVMASRCQCGYGGVERVQRQSVRSRQRENCLQKQE